MIEVGVVIGYLVTWAISKARRAGRNLDKTVDTAIDIGIDRLDELVRTKLGGHPALTELDEEAAKAAESEPADAKDAPDATEVSELTRKQLELSLQSALEKDSAFADQVRGYLEQIDPRATGSDGTSISMTATASGHGRVFQAGRDQTISGH